MKLGDVAGMVKMLWKPIIVIAIIYTGLFYLPIKNVYSINSLILSVVLLYKIISNKPELKDWSKTIVRVIVFTTAIYYMIVLLGAFGIIGFVLIILLLSAYKIVLGWKLYKYTINWGADMLKGKRRRFDMNDIKGNDQDKETRRSIK